MANEAKPETTHKEVPQWLQPDLFHDVLRDTVKGFSKIKNFNSKSGSTAGENYATIMLRVNIEVECEGISWVVCVFKT